MGRLPGSTVRDDANRTRRRLTVFLATPAVVAGAMVIGYGIAAAAIYLDGVRSGGLTERGFWTGLALFWLVAYAALIGMLWLAWRSANSN